MNFISEEEWDRAIIGMDIGSERDRSAVILLECTTVGDRHRQYRVIESEIYQGYEDNSPSLSQPKDNSPMLGGDRKQNAE